MSATPASNRYATLTLRFPTLFIIGWNYEGFVVLTYDELGTATRDRETA